MMLKIPIALYYSSIAGYKQMGQCVLLVRLRGIGVSVEALLVT